MYLKDIMSRTIESIRKPLVLCTAILLGCMQTTLAAAAPPENLLLICADTVRYDVFEALNQRGDTFSRFQNKGLSYKNAQSAAPWTLPSVATVLTGEYPNQHGAGLFSGEFANLDDTLPTPLNPDSETLAQTLLNQDFKTQLITAHPFFVAGFGIDAGFKQIDQRRGWEKLVQVLSKALDKFAHKSNIVGTNPQAAPETAGNAELPQKKVNKKRFFAYLHTMEPHEWHTKDKQTRAEFQHKAPSWLRDFAVSIAPAATCKDETMCDKWVTYVAAVYETRLALTEVFNQLESRSLLDETLIVFYSDHGEEFYDHKEYAQELAEDPRGFYGKGHGQSLFQELIHVPLWVMSPNINSGSVSEIVSLKSVKPAIEYWLGLSGNTQSPLPQADTDKGAKHGIAISTAIAYGSHQTSARLGDEKGIYFEEGERLEGYNLSEDPFEDSPSKEQQYIFAIEPTIIDYLESQPQAEKGEVSVSNESLEKLKAIGYLQGKEN